MLTCDVTYYACSSITGNSYGQGALVATLIAPYGVNLSDQDIKNACNGLNRNALMIFDSNAQVRPNNTTVRSRGDLRRYCQYWGGQDASNGLNSCDQVGIGSCTMQLNNCNGTTCDLYSVTPGDTCGNIAWLFYPLYVKQIAAGTGDSQEFGDGVGAGFDAEDAAMAVGSYTINWPDAPPPPPKPTW